MYHLRKIKVLLATCLLACTSLWAQDVKVSISSATSTSVHNGEGADMAIDGNYSTFWHSGNGSGYTTSFPVTFTIKFASASHVDYVRYTPRTDNSNGNWVEVTVEYCSSTDGSTFETVGTFDLGGSGSSYDFYLNGDAGVTCGQVRFTINSGKGGWASAAEIEAYNLKGKFEAFSDYFSDDLCTTLRSGVTSSNDIEDADVKALVEAMLTNAEGYKKFRVGEYEAYESLRTVQKRLGTKTEYSQYENPTGVYLQAGEACLVAVSGIGNDPVKLKIKNWVTSESVSSYQLRNGLNYIKATTEGNVFVDYYTDNLSAPNVKVHFINAPVQGYWDQQTMNNDDWEALLEGRSQDDNTILFVQSGHVQLAYPVSAWLEYCPTDVITLMGYYQNVQDAIRDLLGLKTYNKEVKNRMLYYATTYGFMASSGEGAYCNVESLGAIMTTDATKFDFWGVGHEWGHNNQIPGFHWSGCGEMTNNIYAAWAQFHHTGNRTSDGRPSVLRLEDENSGIDEYSKMRGGRMQAYFEEALRKGVAWQLQDGPDYHNATPDTKTVTGRDAEGNDIGEVTTTSRNYDHFLKVVPFWQLNLWGILANKNPYIITKVIEAIRTTEDYAATYNTNGKQQINWMKLACEAAKTDLLPFFENAGLLRPIHAYIEDYGAGWNIITEDMINALKASVAAEVAAGRYQAYPDEEINYINGHNYHIYRDNLKLNVTAIQGERDGDKVTIQHSVAQNAVAFETYNAQDELIRITMYGLGSNDEHSFTQVLFPSSFDESENAAYIMAVGYDGERQRVYQTYANEDEAKYGELGRILTGVEAMQAFCNDTKVGYYKSSALTDLNTAYNTAKAVYDKKESAKYAAVYDMLNTEMMKVQNDATARVGIVEGNTYRLENKLYPTYSMSINSSKEMIGEGTDADSQAQQWYFESSATAGRYYIKNRSTSTYPGDVTTSTPLSATATSTSDAYAYELRDMKNGLWALVGSTGLHCDAYKNIVGWGADAEATQWYITVVETNTNAEALNNLQVLVDKAEALIAEIEADGAYSTISTATAQSKVATAKDVVASGTYDASVYNELNDQYTALLNAKKGVDDAALDEKKQGLSTLIGNANSLIAQCGTVVFNDATPDTELALQANNSADNWYVSSNADQNTGGGLKDGDGIAALVDDNTSTYFHTRWGGTVVNEPHYIQVDMGEGKTIQEFVFSYTPRSGSPAPTAMTIYGSNNATSFTQVLATITSGLPAHNSGNSYESSTINSGGAAYRYLRFVVTESAGPGNAQYGGQYFFGMMEFDITEKAKPEGYTVTLGNEAGDVTEELLLTAFKAVQEAQSVVDYANTEAQVNEAIDKLQVQYNALQEAKNAVQYVDFTISSNVAGGGVIYNEGNHTTTLNAPSTLAAGNLTAIALDGYVAKGITVEGTTITVTYNTVYTVQVVGGNGNGRAVCGDTEYADEATFDTDEALTAESVTAKPLTDYEATVTLNEETNTFTVTYRVVLDTTKYYTFNCLSNEAHNTTRFIRDNGSVINGQSADGSLFLFEAADDVLDGYYIKSYVSDKYINHKEEEEYVYASEEKLTVWTIAIPSHTPAARTFTVGNDLYLNNNGNDDNAADGTCVDLQSNYHDGGPGSGNACSLWTLTEGTPLDMTDLKNLIDATNNLIISCYQNGNIDGELVYFNSVYVTADVMTDIKTAVANAQAKYDAGRATTQGEYNTALTALQTANTTLASNISLAQTEASDRLTSREALREKIEALGDVVAKCGVVEWGRYPTERIAVSLTEANLSTNAQETSEGPIENLLKDDETFFHSSWKASVGAAHHIQVDLGEGKTLQEFVFGYTTRNVGPHPYIIVVSGSNDKDGSFEEIKVFNSGLPNTGSTSWEASAPIVASEPYRYLRFTVTKSSDLRSYGEYCFAMSKFGLKTITYSENEDYYVESLSPNGSVTEEQLLSAYRTMVEAGKLDNVNTTKSDLDAMIETLTTLGNDLESALNTLQLPVELTTDVQNPVLYTFKSQRGDAKALQYDPAANHMFSIAEASANSVKQMFYFTMGDTRTQVYVHPFAAGEQVLAASDLSDGKEKVFAAEMSSTEAMPMQWTFEKDNEWYSLNGVEAPYFSNYGGGSNKMGFYGSKDEGSRFQFTDVDETTVEGSAAYHSLNVYYTEAAKVASSEIVGGSNPYYYPEVEAVAYNKAYAAATDALEAESCAYEDYLSAYKALLKANEDENFVLQMPEVGTYYTIVSACGDSRGGQLMYATGENEMKFGNDKAGEDAYGSWIRPEALWTFTEEGYMMNLQTGCYVGTSTWGGALTLVEDDAKKVVSIEPLATLNGQVMLKPGNGYPLHAQVSGSKIVGYSNENNASAWRIVEVEDMSSVNCAVNVGEYGHTSLYLNYPVTIPEGVKAYIIDGTDIDIDANGVGTLKLTQLTGNVLPAQTAVIVEAAAGSYNFHYTDDAATDNVEGNRLQGSAYVTYREAEEGHNYYIFGVGVTEGVDAGVVGLYKNFVEYTAAGVKPEEGTEDAATHYRMSANKVLFDWDNTAQTVTSFRFRIDGDATGIDNIGADGNAVIYDLYGRRILEVVSSGIYIINGEKRYVHVK